jgi:hypothetical protein
MMPEMQQVNSRAIEMLGYDELEMTLYVMFKGGATYAYRGVPPHVYQQLMVAESMGSFVNAVIKPAFPPERL